MEEMIDIIEFWEHFYDVGEYVTPETQAELDMIHEGCPNVREDE